jgi:hypothetical protein
MLPTSSKPYLLFLSFIVDLSLPRLLVPAAQGSSSLYVCARGMGPCDRSSFF